MKNINGSLGDLSIGRCIVAVIALALLTFSCDGNSAQPTDITSLFRTAVNADLETVNKMLKSNPDLVTCTDEGKNSLLMFAIRAGRTDIVELLVANHADVNAKNIGQVTPLHFAALNGQTEIVKILLDHRADLNAKDDVGHTSLHSAASGLPAQMPDQIVQLLLDRGADVNAKDSEGETPLQLALNHKNIVELLLANKADINAKDDNGFTALHDAAMAGLKDIVELLLAHGADINANDNSGRTPLDVAADPAAGNINLDAFKAGRMSVVKLLLLRKAQYTAFDAAATGDLDAVEAFVKRDPGLVAAKKWHGRTLLHYAALLENKEMAEFLITNKAKIDAADESGETPRAFACSVIAAVFRLAGRAIGFARDTLATSRSVFVVF